MVEVTSVTVRLNFHEQLIDSWHRTNSLLCVGIDPRIEQLPHTFPKDGSGVLSFCKRLIDCTGNYACSFKPNAAFFCALGFEDELAELVSYIHSNYPKTPVLLDAKRGDIGSTADFYAQEAFERYGADAVTVSPFLGWECIESFLKYEDRGVFVLCRTSNEDSDWLQSQPIERPIFLQVAEKIHQSNNLNLGLVVGATHTNELQQVRALAQDTTLLIPGVGVQGGSVKGLNNSIRAKSHPGGLVNVSRGLLEQKQELDFFQNVEVNARLFVEQLTIDDS